MVWCGPAGEQAGLPSMPRQGGQAGYLPAGNQHRPHWPPSLGRLLEEAEPPHEGKPSCLFRPLRSCSPPSPSPLPGLVTSNPNQTKVHLNIFDTRDQSSGPQPWKHSVLSPTRTTQAGEPQLQRPDRRPRGWLESPGPLRKSCPHHCIALNLNLSHCVWATKRSTFQGILPP